MKDNQKRVRLDIVEAGLKYLQTVDWATRREIFNLERANINARTLSLYASEVSKKAWQIPVLDLFVKERLINKESRSDAIYYSIGQANAIETILKDHKDGGLFLSHFVFPNEVPRPSILNIVENQPPNETLQEITDMAIDESKAPMVPHDGKKVEISLEVFLRKLLDAVVDVSTEQKQLRTTIAQVSENTLIAIESVNRGLSSVSEIVRESITKSEKVEARINGFNKRLDEVYNFTKDTKQVTDNNQAVMKKVAGSIESFTTAAETATTALSAVEGLRGVVSRLAQEIRAKEEDKLSDVGRRLNALSTEMGELSSLILNATVRREDGPT